MEEDALQAAQDVLVAGKAAPANVPAAGKNWLFFYSRKFLGS
jgi:hypothetical protein